MLNKILFLAAILHPTVADWSQELLVAFSHDIENSFNIMRIDEDTIHDSIGLGLIIGHPSVLSDHGYDIFKLFFLPELLWDYKRNVFKNCGFRTSFYFNWLALYFLLFNQRS